MTPLERAGKALSEAGGAGNWDHALECARAVLLAIREPSEGMIEAGSAGGDWPWAKGTFQDMIDKALEEG